MSGCTLTSTSAAIKFGSESEDLYRNIIIENCTISRTNRAISLQLRDKGSIENVILQNITINTRLFCKEVYWGCAEPIAITVLKRKEDTNVGTISNVHFSNIFCESENGILIYAEEPDYIHDITFDNVRLSLVNTSRYDKGYHDLRPGTGPAFTEKGLRYIYAHNAANIRFTNCRFHAKEDLKEQLTEDHISNCKGYEHAL